MPAQYFLNLGSQALERHCLDTIRSLLVCRLMRAALRMQEASPSWWLRAWCRDVTSSTWKFGQTSLGIVLARSDEKVVTFLGPSVNNTAEPREQWKWSYVAVDRRRNEISDSHDRVSSSCSGETSVLVSKHGVHSSPMTQHQGCHACSM